MSRNFPSLGARDAIAARGICDAEVAKLTTTFMRLAIGISVAAMIVVGLTNPSVAQSAAPVATQDHNAKLFSDCLLDWDAATHMTKREWSAACQRLLRQRGDYLIKTE